MSVAAGTVFVTKLYHPIRPVPPVRQGVQMTISGVDAARMAISGEVVRGAWPMRFEMMVHSVTGKRRRWTGRYGRRRRCVDACAVLSEDDVVRTERNCHVIHERSLP